MNVFYIKYNGYLHLQETKFDRILKITYYLQKIDISNMSHSGKTT